MDTDTADRLWNAVNTLTQALQLCNCPSSDPAASYFRKVQALISAAEWEIIYTLPPV